MPINPITGLEEEEDLIQRQQVMADLSRKYGYPQGLGDADLAAAQEQARNSRLYAGLGEAFSGLGRSIAGATAPQDNSFYRSMAEGAQQPVQDILTRRKAVQEEQNPVMKYMLAKATRDASDARQEKSLDAAMERAKVLSGQRTEMVGVKNAEKAEKKKEELEALNVPGFERAPGIKQGKDEAEKARKAVGTLASVEKSLDKMQELVDKHGSFEAFGGGSAEMDTLSTTLKIELKNLYELGALSGPDMAILSKQITDPSSLQALFTRNSTAKAGLRATKENLRNTVLSQLKAKGYSPVGGEALSQSAAQQQNNRDKQAIDWARAHMDDPRAKKILQMHGM